MRSDLLYLFRRLMYADLWHILNACFVSHCAKHLAYLCNKVEATSKCTIMCFLHLLVSGWRSYNSQLLRMRFGDARVCILEASDVVF